MGRVELESISGEGRGSGRKPQTQRRRATFPAVWLHEEEEEGLPLEQGREALTIEETSFLSVNKRLRGYEIDLVHL